MEITSIDQLDLSKTYSYAWLPTFEIWRTSGTYQRQNIRYVVRPKPTGEQVIAREILLN
jgi:hypothetical protein